MQNRLIQEFIKYKGLTNDDIAKLWNSSVSDLHSPSLLRNADAFVDTLHSYKTKNILIVPDYDTDGIMSGSLLYAALYELGFDSVNLFTPSMETGFGLSVESLNDALHQFPDSEVIITTDNGIQSHAGIAEANKRGINVLVTDHHPGSDVEPDATVIVDPNSVYDDYPFKGICGGQVVYKLMQHYASKYASAESKTRVFNLYPFAGISAVADMMPMVDENRFFVKQAVAFLKNFAVDNQAHPKYVRVFMGLWSMLKILDDHNKLNYGIDADTIGFYLSPMLNACRRVMGTSRYAFDIFIGGGLGDAEEAALKVWEINEYRKSRSSELSALAMLNFKEKDGLDRHIQFKELVQGIDDVVGYAGLVSGNLTNILNLPTLVFSRESGHGSGRSPEWFNAKGEIQKMWDEHPDWFKSFGGHAGAFGCAVNMEYIDDIREAFAGRVISVIDSLPVDGSMCDDNIDGILVTDNDASLVSDYVNYVSLFEPFGMEFARVPMYYDLTLGSLKDIKTMGSEQQHLKLVGESFTLLVWNYQKIPSYEKFFTSSRGSVIRVRGDVSVNEFRGRITNQFVVNHIV